MNWSLNSRNEPTSVQFPGMWSIIVRNAPVFVALPDELVAKSKE
ncbi:hypothetical protein [Bacillus salacetis]|nr:hypothetical protein [Bacillus salacetis]